ncbi:MAG: TetR/AcrR family transcriptional regulator [Myxococcota bacterium]
MSKPTFAHLPPAKRARIIDAAVEEFSSRSYASVTVDRIVDAAGISKGSLYQYFGGKLALYRWLLTEYLPQQKLQAIEQRLAEVCPPNTATPDPWRELEHAFLAGVRFAARQPRLTRLAVRFLRDLEGEPALTEIRERQKERTHAWIMDLFARSRSELRADLDLTLAATFLAYALGEGMLDVLARRLEVGLSTLLERPELTARLDDDDVLSLAAQATAFIRFGIAKPSEP